MTNRVLDAAAGVASRELLEPLPPDGQLWIFGSSRGLSESEAEELLQAVDGFLEGWKAHGYPLAARRAWLHGHFLLVGADPRVAAPSGCSIDALVRTLKEVENRLGVELVGKGRVWYRDRDGEIRAVSRSEFRARAGEGFVTPETPVFDLSPSRVSEVRQGWEAPARERWHGSAFFS
ncbi:MAG: hypothetical protein WEA09_02700 [Gemmatimonadota bacterium]